MGDELQRRIIVGNKLANILDGLLETSDLLVLAIIDTNDIRAVLSEWDAIPKTETEI